MSKEQRTTTIKHLYKQTAAALDKDSYKGIISMIAARHGLNPFVLSTMESSEVRKLMAEAGSDDLVASLSTHNQLRLWHMFGCQALSLDEHTVDMLTCTAAPELGELVRLDIENSGIKSPEDHPADWNIPYPAFAIELPYAVNIENQGVAEYFRVAVVMPYMDNSTMAPAWSVLYITHEDFARGMTSISNSTSTICDLITNLCVLLNEGGGIKTKAGKRIGYDKAAKKAKSKVSIWNVRTPINTTLPLGMARPYLASGEVPPQTFRVGKRFMVRGHWRNQPCGEGLKGRKRIWIKPHLKGPEEGEAFSRVYQVKATK